MRILERYGCTLVPQSGCREHRFSHQLLTSVDLEQYAPFNRRTSPVRVQPTANSTSLEHPLSLRAGFGTLYKRLKQMNAIF